MDRRNFLLAGTATGANFLLPNTACGNNTLFTGWIYDKQALNNFVRHTRRPYLRQQTTRNFKNSGKGKIVLLHKYLERAIGPIIPHYQAIGDCVGQAFGLAVDILAATQIYGLGIQEKWEAKASTEAAYAGSRYEIGYQVHGSSRLLWDDGSIGLYCAEFLTQYGVLVRKKYDEYDLRTYSPKIAKSWGRTGVPDELEPLAKQHPIQSFALVTSYEDCRDAIVNGYPVIFCSSYGFNANCRNHNPGGRDAQGFLNRCDTWYHAMAGVAVDDTTRPGILICNSWGPNWVDGPTRHDQPAGSFWVDANTIDGMCSQGDSFAISGFVGFPAKRLDYFF